DRGSETDAGRRHRARGHHDARHRRLRDDASDAQAGVRRGAPARRLQREGGGGRAPALHRRRRLRVCPQACRHGGTPAAARRMAPGPDVRAPTARRAELMSNTGAVGAPPAAIAPAILVVDDNAAKRLALRAMLAPLGHTVTEADSGRAALRAVLRDTFALILMDV